MGGCGGSMKRSSFVMGLVCLPVLAAALAGCTTTAARTGTGASFQWTSPSKRVVLIAPDVQLTELTAGGVEEARADWTDAAQRYIADDIGGILKAKNAELVSAAHLDNPHDAQLAKLHNVVGMAVLLHAYGVNTLPNKGSAIDWTLGPGTNDMRTRYGADYGLFVYVRDSYTSGGRVAMMIGAAMLGVSVQGGRQIAFVSLVDLRTGNIVWFNRLVSTKGDLRTEKPAKDTVDDLLQGLPL